MKDKAGIRRIWGRLIRQGGVYALGNLGLKASGLLLAFIYLNPAYLSVEAFGYFSLLIVTSQLGIYAAGLGIGQGLLKFMTDPNYRSIQSALPFTAVVSSAIAAAIILVILWLLAPVLAGLLLDTPERAGLLRLLAAYVALKVVGNIPLMVLRVREQAAWYVAALLAEMLVLLAAAYYLVVALGMGLTGFMLAYAISAGVSTAVRIAVVLVREAWQFEWRLVHRLIKFGVPLILASLASWFLNAGDRYLLKWLADAETVGLYEWAARIAGLLNMLFVQSFNLAFSVIGLKMLGGAEAGGGIHRRSFRHFVIWTGWTVLGLSFLTYDLTLLLPADAAYLRADDLVLLLALGFMAYGIYYIVVNVVYASGRTEAIGVNMLAASILNVLLNVLLIPIWGAFGAALTTFASYVALAYGAAYFARKHVDIRFPWKVLIIVTVFVCGLYLLGRPTSNWPTFQRVGVRVLLLLLYPVLVVSSGLYVREDLRKAWLKAGTWWVNRKSNNER